MADPNDFRAKTRTLLAKRAAQQCSNPNCLRLTSGPAADDDGSVDVGEAAHIRGARPKAKRYDLLMTPEERRDITNGIWLCRACAKLIDSDEETFTVALLYEWKRSHEEEIVAKVRGEGWKRTALEKALRPIEEVSAPAFQIALDRPQNWRGRLAAELLRAGQARGRSRLARLREGALFRPRHLVPHRELHRWLRARVDDLSFFLRGLKRTLLNLTATVSCPESTALEVLASTAAVVEAFDFLVAWEEEVVFVHLSPEAREAIDFLVGTTDQLTAELQRLPDEILSLAERTPESGTGKIVLTVNLPEAWSEKASAGTERFYGVLAREWLEDQMA